MAAQDAPNRLLIGDAPKSDISEDEFGLAKIVDAIADRLLRHDVEQGYVAGLQGAWGSGKSTIANFVAGHIAKASPAHQIIRFDPWLVGDKASFLSFLLGQLATSIDEVKRGRARWWQWEYWKTRSKRRRLANKIRRYGEYAGALAAPVGGLGTADATGTLVLAAAGLKAAGTLSKFLGLRDLSLDKLKAEISNDLRSLHELLPEARILVIIDDTDRLEPTDAVEVLRLVRRAADFPFVSYLVCFDQLVLSKQIRSALRISDGTLYLEKIFHTLIAVPPQEPFALRRYLNRLLTASFPEEMQDVTSVGPNADAQDRSYREHLLFDHWGGRFIDTPRDVVRVFDAVRFGWPKVPKGSDFIDFIWLQLIRLKAPVLHTWVLRYLTNIAAYRDGGRPGDDEPKVLTEQLRDILETLKWTERPYLSGFSEFLPGLQQLMFELSDSKRTVFDFTNGELATFERAGRLGSPTHWRQYFAFDLPTYALSDEFVSLFRAAATSSSGEAAILLMQLLERPHAKTGHFVGVLLDRLIDLKEGTRSAQETVGLARVFAETMDAIALRMLEYQDLGRVSLWDQAGRLLNSNVAEAFKSIVARGVSLNWLASVIRDQGWAHGLPDGERVRTDRQWLSKGQLDEAIRDMIARFKETDANDLFARPLPADILYCWHQLGDPDELRNFISKAVEKDDNQFLNALKAMRGWSTSSEGLRHPLKRDSVERFMNAEEAKTRLERLRASSRHEGIRARAASLLNEWSEERG